MFVGEGPGFNEDREGRPFVGRAGGLLVELLGSIGWRREDVFITNVVKCRPPDNRDPEPDEIAACAPYLRRQLEILDPAVVVTLGRFSMATFMPGVRITQAHGTTRPADPATGARDAHGARAVPPGLRAAQPGRRARELRRHRDACPRAARAARAGAPAAEARADGRAADRRARRHDDAVADGRAPGSISTTAAADAISHAAHRRAPTPDDQLTLF